MSASRKPWRRGGNLGMCERYGEKGITLEAEERILPA